MRAGRDGRGPRRGLVAVALATALAGSGGCRSAPEWSYDRPRVTPAQLDRDLTQCSQQALPSGALTFPSLTGPDRQALNTCMERRGYTVIQRPAGRP